MWRKKIHNYLFHIMNLKPIYNYGYHLFFYSLIFFKNFLRSFIFFLYFLFYTLNFFYFNYLKINIYKRRMINNSRKILWNNKSIQGKILRHFLLQWWIHRIASRPGIFCWRKFHISPNLLHIFLQCLKKKKKDDLQSSPSCSLPSKDDYPIEDDHET